MEGKWETGVTRNEAQVKQVRQEGYKWCVLTTKGIWVREEGRKGGRKEIGTQADKTDDR